MEQNNGEKKRRGRKPIPEIPLEERDPNAPASLYGKYKYQYKYDTERRKNDEEYRKKKYQKQNERNKWRYENDEEFRLKKQQQNAERRRKVEEVYKAYLESQKNT